MPLATQLSCNMIHHMINPTKSGTGNKFLYIALVDVPSTGIDGTVLCWKNISPKSGLKQSLSIQRNTMPVHILQDITTKTMSKNMKNSLEMLAKKTELLLKDTMFFKTMPNSIKVFFTFFIYTFFERGLARQDMGNPVFFQYKFYFLMLRYLQNSCRSFRKC